MSWLDNYYKGVETLGDDTIKLPSDNDAIDKALSLMDATLAEAKQIVADNSGTWASIKAKVTGVSLDVMKNYVTGFEHAASGMHDVGEKLKADPNTTHDRVVDFIHSVVSISNNDVIKESASYNQLTKLAHDVGAQSLADVGNKAKSISESVMDALPSKTKIITGVVIGGVVLVGVGYVAYKVRKAIPII